MEFRILTQQPNTSFSNGVLLIFNFFIFQLSLLTARMTGFLIKTRLPHVVLLKQNYKLFVVNLLQFLYLFLFCIV
jgi:hypothetical protein